MHHRLQVPEDLRGSFDLKQWSVKIGKIDKFSDDLRAMSAEGTVDWLRRSSMPPQLRWRDCISGAICCVLRIERNESRTATRVEARAHRFVLGLLVTPNKALERVFNDVLSGIKSAQDYAHSSALLSSRQS